VGAAIFKLDKDRKLLNADMTWTHQFNQKSAESTQKHINKCYPGIIPEQNACWRWIWLFWKNHNRLRRTSNTNWCLSELSVLLGQVTLELSILASGAAITAAQVIWIVSLYLWYQVTFVIIIVEFLVTVLSITYLRNIIWGWTVPLSLLVEVVTHCESKLNLKKYKYLFSFSESANHISSDYN